MKSKTIFYNDTEYIIPVEVFQIFRRVLHIEQSEIAKELGLSRSAISNWEIGLTDYNYRIQKWYIEKNLLEFSEKFKQLLYECCLESQFYEV